MGVVVHFDWQRLIWPVLVVIDRLIHQISELKLIVLSCIVIIIGIVVYFDWKFG